MSQPLTPKELAARVAELEAEIKSESSSTAVDPQILAKAKSVLQFSVNDVKIALTVLGIDVTDEQKIEIEEALLANKVVNMSESSKRETTSKW